MTTMQEQLDEMLGMAKQVGYEKALLVAAEHRADTAPKGQTARPRREANELRKLVDINQDKLDKARARFLAVHCRELQS